MLNEKEAFESSINGLTAFLEQHTQNCHCFDETELEQKIHELETLNANLDAKFLTLQNVSELKENNLYEVLYFYRKLGNTRSNVRSALTAFKDRNDLIKFLKIELKVTGADGLVSDQIRNHLAWLEKIKAELLKDDFFSTREKVIIWCGALERVEKTNLEKSELKEILKKEIVLVKNRFMKAPERGMCYEQQAGILLNDKDSKNLDSLQHLFGVSQRPRCNRRTS